MARSVPCRAARFLTRAQQRSDGTKTRKIPSPKARLARRARSTAQRRNAPMRPSCRPAPSTPARPLALRANASTIPHRPQIQPVKELPKHPIVLCHGLLGFVTLLGIPYFRCARTGAVSSCPVLMRRHRGVPEVFKSLGVKHVFTHLGTTPCCFVWLYGCL